MDDIPYETAIPLTKASLAFNNLKNQNTGEDKDGRCVSTSRNVLDDDIVVECRKLKTHILVSKSETVQKMVVQLFCSDFLFMNHLLMMIQTLLRQKKNSVRFDKNN